MVSLTSIRRAAPGFWAKTQQQFAQSARIALNLEGLSIPLKPYPILDFAEPQTSTWMRVLTDKQIGGFSDATCKHVDATADEPPHMLFSGTISQKLPIKRIDVGRTGYAAWRNEERGRSLFGDVFWDVDSYMYLAMRVKSDGRKYFVNVRTDSIFDSDVHQHRLYTKHHKGANGPGDPGRWETVLLKWHQFVRTSYGDVEEPQSEILQQKVKTVGVATLDRSEGPFELGIGAIWATNLNERGQLDGQIGYGEGDQGSARLHNVTEEKLRLRDEEKRIRSLKPSGSIFGKKA